MNIVRSSLILLICSISHYASAQTAELKDNWNIQFGTDMSLQKPYNHPASDMFSKGRSLGVNMSVGKWFTPELGLRTRLNWENGIIDSKAEWLAPFNKPGVNHDKGGYISVVGDIMLDLHNTVQGFNKDRNWNSQLFLRAGGVYNNGTDKGSPLIGLGLSNTYRIDTKWKIFLDAALNGVSSGFTKSKSTATGKGTGSNQFFDISLGVQYDISNTFAKKISAKNTLADRSFWNGWFVQVGMDMTLLNPVEKDFSDVLTEGRTYGIDVALGKRFSPVAAARAKLNWENGLIENKKFQWLGHDDKYTSNYDGGGNLMMYFDGILSVKNMIMPYNEKDKWDTYLIGRMGLGSNRAEKTMSPVVGIGIGESFKLTDRLNVFAESTYEGITSEFFDGISWSGSTGCRFNGIWDFNVGLQINL